jgi:hypothetical protein
MGGMAMGVVREGARGSVRFVAAFISFLFFVLLGSVFILAADSSGNGSSKRSKSAAKLHDFGIAEVRLINDAIAKAWTEHKLVPSKAATDGEWCRRVYLDVLGRVPTVEELQAYTADRKRDKRARLVDRLLGDKYAEDFARNWTTFWTNLLIGRIGGAERRSLVDRAGYSNIFARRLGTTSRTTSWRGS